jgi:uncharacterized protein (DUF1697 family)
MTTWVAFLRAINVGGHTVKMYQLRELFETAGFANVATFIASGNVIFDAGEHDARALEARIEAHLQATLGYAVATFLRAPAELARIAARQPFPGANLGTKGTTLYVVFAASPLSAAARSSLVALQSGVDEFHVEEREIYWLRRVSIADRAFPSPPLERILAAPVTMRNMNTVQRIAAKYPPP